MAPAEGNTDLHLGLPPQAPDDHIEHPPTTISPMWTYTQKHPRGGDKRWNGHIRQVSGEEGGDRPRNDIANVIAELLHLGQERTRQKPSGRGRWAAVTADSQAEIGNPPAPGAADPGNPGATDPVVSRRSPECSWITG